MKQEQSDKYYLKVAELCSQNSSANRLKVGAIIVKDNQIISDGFNGTPSGFDNVCEITEHIDKSKCLYCSQEHCEGCRNIRLVSKPEVLHAESNAITKCARCGNASNGATIYITHSPCIECAKLIIQSGIKRVVYHDMYRSDDGIKLLMKANIEVEQK
jgi:dCMP deaminase